MSVIDLGTRIEKLHEYARSIGMEIYEKNGVTLYPSFDSKGALSPWFCMYVRNKEVTQEKTQ